MSTGTARALQHRVVGVDVARCVALLGMMATHVLYARDPDGTLSAAHWLAGGRASALFAVLAGVSLALVTGGVTPVRGVERVARSTGIVVRALLVGALGLVLGALDSGLAIILAYYAVLFVLALPFLGFRTPVLFALGAGWVVAAPVVSHLVRPLLPERGFASPEFQQLSEPGRLLAELAFTGYYPAVPWMAYALVGLGVGRLNLRDRRIQACLIGLGAYLTVAATVLSRFLTERASVQASLLAEPPYPGSFDELFDQIAEGTHGTTPTGGAWEWLLVVAPHSATPFDLAQTIGSALLVIGCCLMFVDLLPQAGARAAALLFGAGTMTLTLYSLHVVMVSPLLPPVDEPETYRWHVLVVLAVGLVFVGLGKRGPLEACVGLAAGRASSGVRRVLRAD